VKSEEQSAWVVVIASLSAACILLAIGTMFVAESDALPSFATLAVVLAIVATALSGGARRDRQGWVVASLVAAFWAVGLWVLWRTWRLAGGVYDHVFPSEAHDRFWRVAFQLVSIPIVALAPSELHADRLREEGVEAHCCLLKPISASALLEWVAKIDSLGVAVVTDGEAA